MAKEKTTRTTTRSKKAAIEAPVVPAAAVEAAAPEAAPVVTKTAVRKTIVRKPEVKAPVIPINVDEEIRRRAYELSEKRGFVPGHEAEDWLAAEQEVISRYQVRTA
jgi:hypothetical protein